MKACTCVFNIHLYYPSDMFHKGPRDIYWDMNELYNNCPCSSAAWAPPATKVHDNLHNNRQQEQVDQPIDQLW